MQSTARAKSVIIHADGGARGNPGPAAIGIVIRDAGSSEVLWERGEKIGETTNNQAEYRAVLAGLVQAKRLGATNVSFFLDSELVVSQLNQVYKVKSEALQKLFVQIWNAQRDFQRVAYTHIPREKNRRADGLVNAALDAR